MTRVPCVISILAHVSQLPCHSNRRCWLPSCVERSWLTHRSTSEICVNFLSSKLQTALEGIPVETRATYLLSSMRNGGVTEDVRQMAAVLLRRVISNEFEDFYSKVCIIMHVATFISFWKPLSLTWIYKCLGVLISLIRKRHITGDIL